MLATPLNKLFVYRLRQASFSDFQFIKISYLGLAHVNYSLLAEVVFVLYSDTYF